jgi:hypothetical protein
MRIVSHGEKRVGKPERDRGELPVGMTMEAMMTWRRPRRSAAIGLETVGIEAVECAVIGTVGLRRDSGTGVEQAEGLEESERRSRFEGSQSRQFGAIVRLLID